jgi:hypothetical protein
MVRVPASSGVMVRVPASSGVMVRVAASSGVMVRVPASSGVMVRVPASSVVNSGFQPRSDETKDYKIGICYFSAKHAAVRRKSKDWLVRNQDNVSEWVNMSICRLLFQ